MVPTDQIKEAVRYREHDVLSALHVDWKKGKPHIICPYPGHADNSPSWRWDEKKALAFCTCIDGAHSIFDIVMAIQGDDFESAKLFVAEILGRKDLLRTSTPETPRFPASTAASLLNPPKDNRDDDLVREYLSYRLGYPPPAIVMPTTPFAGWKAFPYFDPPPVKKPASGPVHVGNFPCAAFGTIGTDGKTHAHRIYLAPNGQGKADLGKNGRYPRNPKKAAKAALDDNISGRCVFFGDREKATTFILCEGIETAAAVAMAFEGELLSSLAVAAAVSATGLEAFIPPAQTRKIIIAADRDEAPKENGIPGSRRGEKAARTLALHLHDRPDLKCSIALPGLPESNTDFLDLLRSDGATTVRQVIKEATPFVPTKDELDGEAHAQDRASRLEEIAALYPLPVLEGERLSYQYTETGRVMTHRTLRERSPLTGRMEDMLVPICSPFSIPARLRKANKSDRYDLRMIVRDMEGHPRNIDFDAAKLAQHGARDVMAELIASGMRIAPQGKSFIPDILMGYEPQQCITSLSYPGWHTLPDQNAPIFIAPDGTIIGTDTTSIELSVGMRFSQRISQAGNFDEWKKAVSAALEITDCPHWTLGILSGFAGPLVSLIGMDTCGINFSGLSSSGKSTAQRLAVSAWTTPDIHQPGLYQTARTTSNAIEALAARSNGTILSLDEMAHINGKEAGQMIYTIAGGTGKNRMTSDATPRDRYTWSTFTVLSSECSLAEKIIRDGGEWSAGMAVRIVDIDVTGINRTVDSATLKTIDAIMNNYGHAGQAFIKALIEHHLHEHTTDLFNRIDHTARSLAGNVADSATVRAALPFAILMEAGKLARAFAILPAYSETESAVQWAWSRFLQSADSLALDPERQAIILLQEFIQKNWNVQIKSVYGDGSGSREAEGWYDSDAVYLPPSTVRKVTGTAIKEREVGKMLHTRGLLIRQDNEPNRHTIRRIPNIGNVRAYALKRSDFGREEPQFQNNFLN